MQSRRVFNRCASAFEARRRRVNKARTPSLWSVVSISTDFALEELTNAGGPSVLVALQSKQEVKCRPNCLTASLMTILGGVGAPLMYMQG